jgi:hypothetical protein
MSASDMDDAALTGFDCRELVKIPSLHAGEKWEAYEAARRTMSGHLSRDVPCTAICDGTISTGNQTCTRSILSSKHRAAPQVFRPASRRKKSPWGIAPRRGLARSDRCESVNHV